MLARRGVQANELTEAHRAQEVRRSSPDNRNPPQSPSEPRPQHPQNGIEPTCHSSPSTPESASATFSSTIRQALGKSHDKQLHKPHNHHHHHHEWDNLPGITSEAEVLRQIKMQHQQREQQREHHDWDDLPGITSEAEVLRQMEQREQQREQQRERDQGHGQSQNQNQQSQGHEVQGGNNNKPKQAEVPLEEEGQAGSSTARCFSKDDRGQEVQDKGKQREGDSPNRGRAAGSTGKTHETKVESWSRSRERRRSSAKDEAGIGRIGAGAAEEGYDPNNYLYNRGASVETSRFGME